MKETMSVKIEKEVKDKFYEICEEYDIKKSDVILILVEGFIKYVKEI